MQSFLRLSKAKVSRSSVSIPKRSFFSAFNNDNIINPKFESELKKQSNENRDLILSILKLTTTRRETNNYLTKYSTSLNTFGNKRDEESHQQPFRLIFVKIRGFLQHYDQLQLTKLGGLLNHIHKLGGFPILIIDADHLQENADSLNFKQIDNILFNQFNLLTKLFEEPKNDFPRLVPIRCSLSTHFGTEKNVDHSISLDKPFLQFFNDHGIPVLFPYIYDHSTSKEYIVNTTEYLRIVMEQLLKFNPKNAQKLSIEKIIFIDELGGIPSVERSNNSHVFINLNQEFDRIASELHIGHLSLREREIHTDNLKSMKVLLDSLPDYIDGPEHENISPTGLITTLDIAVEKMNLNPIIYNILTDRSLVSSSLSPSKFRSNEDLTNHVIKTTIFKKGLQVKVLKSFDEIDLIKFKELIDDSFKRRLNLEHYLKRVSPIVAKIIIVGDYDGIAIVTNETSKITGLSFPYLDKFAIQRKAQGSLGVADMIFNILKGEYTNNALLWRSRKINPVNGWYFQRSSGSLNLQDSEFRLFWNVNKDSRLFKGKKLDNKVLNTFVDIAKNIEPSFEKN